MALFIGRDWVQLLDVDHEFQRCQRVEGSIERYVYMSTQRSINEEDGADFPPR
jgi:hypothetical protein